jgi:hypothetical protein
MFFYGRCDGFFSGCRMFFYGRCDGFFSGCRMFFYGRCDGFFSGCRMFYPIFFFLQVLGNKNVSTLFLPHYEMLL